jgi:hypothetical protein
MINVVNPNPKRFVYWKTSAAVNKGQLVVISGGLALPAAEAVAGAYIVGVAAEDAASGATCTIIPVLGEELEFDIYQGGATDTFATAGIGTLYDIYVDGAAGDLSAEGEMYLDPNDTDGAFVYLMRFDNTARKAWGRVALASTLL